jgi:hypothetical protein
MKGGNDDSVTMPPNVDNSGHVDHERAGWVKIGLGGVVLDFHIDKEIPAGIEGYRQSGHLIR